MAEQAAQKALKAFLASQGERALAIHSVEELALRCARLDQGFKTLRKIAGVLDQYYIPTRYPDALAFPAVPFEVYQYAQASEAVKYAERILKRVAQKIGY